LLDIVNNLEVKNDIDEGESKDPEIADENHKKEEA
jgi:hypothetical protein